MTSQDIKNKFIIFNIQRNYKFLSKYLANLQNHINYCYDINIISLYQRNIVIGKIYELVKDLNAAYNEFIINKMDNNCNILDKYLDIKLENFNDSTFFNGRNYLKNLYNLTFKNEINTILYPLDTKRFDIIKLSEKYGALDIKSILEIILKLDLKIIYSEYTNIYLDFLNKLFIPLKFNISDQQFKKINILSHELSSIDLSVDDLSLDEYSNNDETEDNIYKYIDDINIYIKNVNNDEILNRVVCIEIKYYNKTVIIEGLFIQDSINIYVKTCQISNKFLYYKKKLLENKLVKCRATRKFSKSFFKTLTIFEILSYNNDFIDFIDNNYDKYMILIGKTFMNIMKEFIKKNNTITDMFTTIRLLLLGNEENINIAGLLFEITKEKKINSNLIYDLIDKNLNYVSQIKLKKTIVA